ncbi:MAG TPA: hypothetical protein PKI55_06335 [Chitinophagaceae bacterium]|nr:hypothetical protein [Chitinophagaceae bacterium]
MALSRSAKYYQENPKARKKKQKYDAALNKRPEQVKKRVELNAYNRKATKAGRNKKGDGKDASHKFDKIVGYVQASKNRGDTNNSQGDKNARGKKKK